MRQRSICQPGSPRLLACAVIEFLLSQRKRDFEAIEIPLDARDLGLEEAQPHGFWSSFTESSCSQGAPVQ